MIVITVACYRLTRVRVVGEYTATPPSRFLFFLVSQRLVHVSIAVRTRAAL